MTSSALPASALASGDLVQLCRDDGALSPDAFQVVEVRPGRIKLRFGDRDEWRPVGQTAKVQDDTPHRARVLLDRIDDAVAVYGQLPGVALHSELLPDGRLIVTDADGGQWLVTAAPYAEAGGP